MNPAEFASAKGALSPSQKVPFEKFRLHIIAKRTYNAHRIAEAELTDEQAEAADEESNTCRLEDPGQLLIFVTGGAGTGKSFVIKVLYELIVRALPVSPLGPSIALLAPTGEIHNWYVNLTILNASNLIRCRCCQHWRSNLSLLPQRQGRGCPWTWRCCYRCHHSL